MNAISSHLHSATAVRTPSSLGPDSTEMLRQLAAQPLADDQLGVLAHALFTVLSDEQLGQVWRGLTAQLGPTQLGALARRLNTPAGRPAAGERKYITVKFRCQDGKLSSVGILDTEFAELAHAFGSEQALRKEIRLLAPQCPATEPKRARSKWVAAHLRSRQPRA